MLPELDPYHLGHTDRASTEHKIFVQGVLWQINSFDQMGGSSSAKQLGERYSGRLPGAKRDASTAGLFGASMMG